MHLIASTTFGLEAVVARELKQLGYERQSTEDGKVTFEADASAIARANLWLRSAERVLVQVGQFEARDFGELFDRTTALPWEDWLPENAYFPVRGRSVRSQLHSTPDCQAIVKKAIVERLKQRHHKVWFEENGPTFTIEVALLKDRATLTIDTTGPGLHKRGYRKLVGEAPLKETLAAALIQLSYWNSGRMLLDPFCGSGTIPIEAALLGRKLAPGLNRTFVSEDWPIVPPDVWQQARDEARAAALPKLEAPIVGSDIAPEAIKLARHHATLAGVADDIRFEHRDFARITSEDLLPFGCLIANPPYGERLGELEEAEALYQRLGTFSQRLNGWSMYVLTSHKEFEPLFGRASDRRRKLFNGRIECTYYQYQGPRPPSP
ncbi:MAG: class I SAM-dependent RNA methyltransferase [Planctomycetaceae bacterium]